MAGQVGQVGQVNQVGQVSQVGQVGGKGPRGVPLDGLEAARQQNLEKIQHLQQTLEAAHQQEAQFKSQMDIMSHLHAAQQQEQHYKHLEVSACLLVLLQQIRLSPATSPVSYRTTRLCAVLASKSLDVLIPICSVHFTFQTKKHR